MAIPSAAKAKPLAQYCLSVRAFCEWACRRGPLSSAYLPSPLALEGIEGQQRIAQNRGTEWHAEHSLSIEYQAQSLCILLRGRADGYAPSLDLVEEIKTVRVMPDLIPEAVQHLHWSQVETYAAILYFNAPPTKIITLRLSYWHRDLEQEFVNERRVSALELMGLFIERVELVIKWYRQVQRWEVQRNASLSTLNFPYTTYRQGQKQLAEQTWQSIRRAEDAVLCAPTGLGKTMATLFAGLKSLPTDIDALWFLTAKNAGRESAQQALDMLSSHCDLHLLQLQSKQDACLYPEKLCESGSCPLAERHFDLLPDARQRLWNQKDWFPHAIRERAQELGLCPYYLQQDLAFWADVVIADYNYIFDTTASHPYFLRESRRTISVIIDEAHNLPSRARTMFSATLTSTSIELAYQSYETAGLKRLRRYIKRYLQAQTGFFDEPPKRLISYLEKWLKAEASWLQQHREHPVLRDLQNEISFWLRIAQRFDKHYRFESNTETGCLILHNLHPADLLKERSQLLRNRILLSATLKPFEHTHLEQGLRSQWRTLDLSLPFPEDNLRTFWVPLDMRFKQRGQHLPTVARWIKQLHEQQPCNRIVFCPSFAILRQLADLLSFDLCQQAAMATEDRTRFVQQLRQRHGLLAGAVLGGAFSEGINLEGSALQSVIIIGTGLPQFNDLNEQRRYGLDQLQLPGYEIVYRDPGLHKIIQAGGRLIRTMSDTGSLYLVDTRYGTPAYRALLPSWWHLQKLNIL